ncbi:ferric-chelate reductase 1-like isoform X1 [Mizuhopecten yessoensis]|uniref:ferric-chelate reductase 1-like isoform X1 n=1 Tax=Mizuhopecten yessoensis TaxID=6573 RepID=UPI000B45CA07|nr:ferric-chelate reductase 1-like isoform X1 [Mizuhopecten yessoensis]
MIVLTCVYMLIGVFSVGVNSYPQGAPTQTESCVNLQPVHRDRQTQQRIPNRQEKAPYSVLLSQQYFVACQNPTACQQKPIQVVIRGIPNQQIPGAGGRGTPFRGFIIQARTPSGGTRAWGRFLPTLSRDYKTISCSNGPTLTHTRNSDKQEIRFNWIPEPGMREQVQFVATIVQNLRTIYPLVYSSIIKPANDFFTTTPIPTTTTPTTITTTSTSPTSTSDIFFNSTITSAITVPLTSSSTQDSLINSGTTTKAGLSMIIASFVMTLL